MSKARSVTDLQSKRPVEDVGFSEVDHSQTKPNEIPDWNIPYKSAIGPNSAIGIAEGVARRIKHEMSLRGMSQADLVRVTGLNKNSLSNLLLAKTDGISWDALQEISTALRVSVDSLTKSDEVEGAMTGFENIDRIVHVVTNNLFSGEAGYERVKNYFADDYALVYADIQPDTSQEHYYNYDGSQTTRHGPDAETEFRLNSTSTVAKIDVSKINIYRTKNLKVTNVPVIGVFTEITVVKPLKAKLESWKDDNFMPHSRSHEIQVAYGFDMWNIDTPIRDVIMNPTMDFKITTRYVSSYKVDYV